jgi:hypothetical protein
MKSDIQEDMPSYSIGRSSLYCVAAQIIFLAIEFIVGEDIRYNLFGYVIVINLILGIGGVIIGSIGIAADKNGSVAFLGLFFSLVMGFVTIRVNLSEIVNYAIH